VSVATKTRFTIVFLMILALGLPLGFPAEDVPETTYDESEALPYVATPLFSSVVVQVATGTNQDVLSFSHPKPGAPSRFTAAGVHDTDGHQSADARTSLTLLCTLRC
jgi:hypothetical protein